MKDERKVCSKANCKTRINLEVQGDDSWYCVKHETMRYAGVFAKELSQ